MYDVIIVGGGAAGLTAAIYTQRKGLSTVVIAKEYGGATATTNHIENYPGVDAQHGMNLMMKFKEGAEKFGAELITTLVEKVEKVSEGFSVTCSNGETYTSKGLILAYGKKHRKLNVPGEDEFFGKGVSTCTTCDAPLFRNKKAAVVGGGNSAFEGALDLVAVNAEKVYLIHRSENFRADEITVDKVKNEPKIEMILNSNVKEIKGDKFITSATVETPDGVKELELDGIFLEIGWIADNDMLGGMLKLNEEGEVIINSLGETSEPGVFAAGDITNTPYKQTVISAGDGARAALQLHKWLNSQ